MKIIAFDKMIDIRDPQVVEITVDEDETTLWVNTEAGCVLRIQGITKISMEGKLTDQLPHDPKVIDVKQLTETAKEFAYLDVINSHDLRRIARLIEQLEHIDDISADYIYNILAGRLNLNS